MIYAVLFEDNKAADPDIRKNYMQAHLAFLRSNAEQIVSAGPLLMPDGAPYGGLWLVNASDETIVEVLIKEDPFWSTGLRADYLIYQWSLVFGKGNAVL